MASGMKRMASEATSVRLKVAHNCAYAVYVKTVPEEAMKRGARKPYAGTGIDGYCGPKLSARKEA